MKEYFKKSQYIKIVLLIAILTLIIVYFGNVINVFKKIFNVLSPLLLGFIMAYIINILVKIIEKHYFPKSKNKFILKTRRIVPVILSLLIGLLVIFLVINLVLPQIIDTFISLSETMPGFIEKVIGYIEKNEDKLPNLAELLDLKELNKDTLAQNIIEFIKPKLGGILSSSIGIISGVTSSFINLFLAFVFTVYLLICRDSLLEQYGRIKKAFMRKENIDRIENVFSVINNTFSSFIVGQFIEALVLGSLCTIGMIIFKFPYATSVGVFVGVTALIPIVGAFIGAAVGVILIVAVDPIKAVLFILFFIILQQLEGNLIYPRIVGTTVGLPSIWVFVAVTIGGGLGGIVGMMIAVPITATIYKLLNMEVNNRLKNLK